ncbi:hypothetical protein [Amycolatopsis sp. NBC_01480]|uniref:hypothetical protein n=1 Tax=Amycolatopsis sp. NBC_01480 TaxID=2903562 RepID=UPI002E27D3AC|nr:hypothetical protein [Amycolatopsis sp. NBC_01480]
MSTDTTPAAPRPGRATLADLEARLRCPAVPVDPDTGLAHALDDYLAAGFDIECASDGWMVLRKAGCRFVLALTTHGGDAPRTAGR